MCVMLRQGEGSNLQPDIGESGHAQVILAVEPPCQLTTALGV
jgi:hypothetical protein